MEAQIRNFVGVDRFDVKLDGITLICGRNEQGKTSTLRAIAAALTRMACPVVLPGSTEERMKEAFAKKDFKSLVRNGTDKASVAILTQSGAVTVEWPSGAVGEQGKAPQASIYAAGVLRYGDLPDTAKQVLLAKVAGAEPTFDDWKAECVDKGFGDAMTLKVWQQVQAESWDKVEKGARENGASIKGQWKEVTGEGGNWGSEKGDKWVPKGMTEADLSFCRDILSHTGKELTEAIDIGEAGLQKAIDHAQAEVDAAIGRSAVDAAERTHLEQIVADGRAVDIAKLAKAVANLEQQATALQAERDALPPSSYSALSCPWDDCGKPIELVRASAAETRVVKANKRPSESELKTRRDAIARKDGQMDGVRTQLSTARQEHNAAQSRIAAANDAAARLRASEDPDDGTALDDARARFNEAEGVKNRCGRFIRAQVYHRKILVNAKWVDLLEPEGARKTVLIRKIKPLNDRLKQLCDIAKAGVVRIRADRELEAETDAGAVHYSLLSEAAAMRADTFMQLVIAERDKSDVVVIDRFDKHDGPWRGKMLDAIISTGLPSVIGCTYAKETMPPRLSGKMGHTYWLEGGLGRLLDPQQKAA